MCHVIQNFLKPNPVRVVNQRSQLIFLFRNFYNILTWTITTFQFYLQPHFICFQTNLLQRLGSKLFSRGFSGIFKKSVKKWKFFIALSLNKSLEYWLFRKGTLFLLNSLTCPKPQSLSFSLKTYFLNQKYNYFLISNISLHKKPFRMLTFKFLQNILLFWESWNRNHVFSLRFFVGIHEVLLLYFYNMYIFKVYHL